MALLILVRISLYIPGPLESLGLFEGLILSTGALPSDLSLLEVPAGVSPNLGVPTFPSSWAPPVPAWLALVLFQFPPNTARQFCPRHVVSTYS
jgi:hypothetical protein